ITAHGREFQVPNSQSFYLPCAEPVRAEQERSRRSYRIGSRKRRSQTMTEMAEEKIVRNLAQAMARLNEDLDKVELWTAALGYFQTPVPDYRPGDQYLLPVRPRNARP